MLDITILAVLLALFGTLNAFPKPEDEKAPSEKKLAPALNQMSEVVEKAKTAVEDLSLKEAKKLTVAVEAASGQTIEQQEEALKKAAESGGDAAKKAVNTLIEAKAKEDAVLKDAVKQQSEKMSDEAKQASEKVVEIIQDKKATVDDKVSKAFEVVDKLSEKAKAEMNVKNTEDFANYVKSQSGDMAALTARAVGLETAAAGAALPL